MLERNEEKRYVVKFACLDSLVPKGHWKIKKAVDFNAAHIIKNLLIIEKLMAILK